MTSVQPFGHATILSAVSVNMPLPRRTGAGILSLRHFSFLEGTEFPLEAKLGGPLQGVVSVVG